MNSVETTLTWTAVGPVEAFPADGGAAVRVDGQQIAVFNYGHAEWYAVQNECPHEKVMAISRGLCGDKAGEPKVSCPLHKNSFSLADGRHLGGNPDWCLKTYPVKAEGGTVWVGTPG